MVRLGFVGLGKMGVRIAERLQAQGHDVVITSRRASSAAALVADGARWVDSPREVAAACKLVFMALPSPDVVESVATGPDGLIEGLAAGSVVFDLSTNSPSVVRRLEEIFRAKGVDFLDAPVSGGPRGAASGKLAMWVGGDRTAFDRHKSLLDMIADRARHVGPAGSGSIAKLVHNCAQYALNCVLAEVFTLGVKAGIEPLALFGAVRDGTLGRRRTFDGLIDQFLPGEFDSPNFALSLATKDVLLATELARELCVPMRMGNLALAEMTEALSRGWGERDSRVAMLLQEERAGVAIAVERDAIDRLLLLETS